MTEYGIPQKGGVYASPAWHISRCVNNAGFSRWCVGTPAASHLILFSGCSERRGHCVLMGKREAGASEVDAVYQWEMGAMEEFLVMIIFHPGFQSFGDGFCSGKK
jgi:hypothetical protein